MAISHYEKKVIAIDITAIEIIKSILLPIALMVAGWLYGRYNKVMDSKDITISKLTEHVNNLEDTNLDARLGKVESEIVDLHEQLNDSFNQFNEVADEVKDAVSDIKDDQEHLTKASQMNGRYTHELAILLMTLSEGIRDQHLDGNITSAIIHYRKFEQEVLAGIVSSNIDTESR